MNKSVLNKLVESELSENTRVIKILTKGSSSSGLGKLFDGLRSLPVQVRIDPKDESTPNAWDSGASISGDNFIIEGGVDSNGFGSVKITLPLSKVDIYYDIHIDLFATKSPDVIEKIIELITTNDIFFEEK